jgi:hypothetical protein
MNRRIIFVLLFVLVMSILAIGCKTDEEGNPVADDPNQVGSEWRKIEWQGLIDHVGEDVNFYVAHDGTNSPPGRVRQTSIDDHGQAGWSGYIDEITETDGVVYYYIDANEDEACTTLFWEPSGAQVFPDAEDTIKILYGIGNERDGDCDGFK